MHDALVCSRRFRTFNVVDGFNHGALVIEIDLNIPAQRVIRMLSRIVTNRGYLLDGQRARTGLPGSGTMGRRI